MAGEELPSRVVHSYPSLTVVLMTLPLPLDTFYLRYIMYIPWTYFKCLRQLVLDPSESRERARVGSPLPRGTRVSAIVRTRDQMVQLK